MDIKDDRAKHRYEVEVPGGTAFAAYRLEGGRIIFTHTEVPEASEGQGVGEALVRFAVEDARARGLEIVPLCPFVAAWIAKHPNGMSG